MLGGGQQGLRVSVVQAELYEQRAEAFLQLCDFQSAALNFRKVLTLGPAREQHCLARLALVLDLQVSYHSVLPACSPAPWPC